MYLKEILPELRIRWKKIQDAMKEQGTEALILTSSVNLYYASGRVFNGIVYFTQTHDPVFFVRRPVGLDADLLYYIRKPEEVVSRLDALEMFPGSNIALEADSLSFTDYNRLASLFPEIEKRNATPLIREVRAVKTDYEIEKMKESGRKHDAMYAHVNAVFEEGMTDAEMSNELEYIGRQLGNLGIFRIFGSSMETYAGSVLAGDNADNPSPYDFSMGGEGLDPSLPMGANGTVLRPGMSLMIDLGGNFNGYMTDMSRTFAIHKINNPLAIEAHRLSIAIQEAIKKVAKPGVTVKELYTLALEMVKEKKLEAYFMGHNQQAAFIGHGVGIEINELPVLAPRSPHVLKVGMTFALEPKFVIPGVGAVGVENTFVVHADGVEQLTNFPEELQELF